MADVTLAAQAVEDAPLAYPIPGAAELLLKLLTADYDGTGAGGDYVPCVQITLADGTVAGTFPLGQTVAAGSSVDVSWFPNGGGVTPSDLFPASLMSAQVQLVGNYAVTTGDPGTVIVWDAATYDSGTPTPFWDAGTPKRLYAPVDGIYQSFMNLIWDNNTAVMVGGQFATYIYRNTEVITLAGSFAKEDSGQIPQAYCFPGQSHRSVVLNAGDYVIINAYCNTGTGGATPATVDLLDLRTIAGDPPLFCSWTLNLVATLP